MGALFFYLFIALFISFICSLTEAVLLSINQSYLVTIKNKYKWANSFLNYKQNVDKPLSAILALNTIAHPIGAAGVGAEATKLFGDASLGIVSAILTVLILIFSEIIPKTLGAKYCKNLSKSTYFLIKWMILTYPLVVISFKVTQLFSKKTNTIISREELSAMADLGFNEGIFSEDENRIIQNILNLKKIKVTEILTPRVVIVSANENLSLESYLVQKPISNFSRIPLFSEQKEKITGYIEKHF